MEKKKYQLSFQINQQSDRVNQQSDREIEKLQIHKRYSSRAVDDNNTEKEQTEIYHRGSEEVQRNESDEYNYRIRTSPRIPIHYGGKRGREHSYESSFLSRHPQKDRWAQGFKYSSKIVVIASAAIGLGLLFGLTVLNIFSNLANEQGAKNSTGIEQPAQTDNNIQKQNQEQPTPNESTEQTELEENPTLIPTGTVQNGEVQFIPRSYFVVQAGAFSEKQAAQELLKQYTDKGYAGLILDRNQPYRLFVGFASSKEDANYLGQYYVGQGFESYVKEHVTPEGSLKLNMKENEIKLFPAFLSQGDQMINLITQVTAKGIQDPATDISNDNWKEIQELHRGYLQTGHTVLEGWDGEEKQFGEQMIKQISTAVNALETYRQQQHIAYLWQSQQALLHYLLAYESLIVAGKE